MAQVPHCWSGAVAPPAMDPQPSAGPPLRQKHQNGILNGNKEISHWILRKLPRGEAGETWEVGEPPSVFAKYVLGEEVRLNLSSVQEGPSSHGSALPQGAAHQGLFPQSWQGLGFGLVGIWVVWICWGRATPKLLQGV